jgi:PDZ domain-containing secreted protein
MNKWVVIGGVCVVAALVYFRQKPTGSNLSTTGTPLKLHSSPMTPYNHTTVSVKVINFFEGISKWNPNYYNIMPKKVETQGADDTLLAFNLKHG